MKGGSSGSGSSGDNTLVATTGAESWLMKPDLLRDTRRGGGREHGLCIAMIVVGWYMINLNINRGYYRDVQGVCVNGQ